ncbi:MAG: ribosomal protein L3 N(5)-glutamine methyltransferase [Candidatus Muproteobacteria bacterium RBG_16_64_11]|uniref:Ribosomal protein L3 N(5)-glutamine methyltransferase n=1 Tax=Candidatus Muproteobacteria bacterium RBG_16_64_11 TaxID=1817758 RepID=A0A1F6TH97_9PROT|nr:MAG: ribosomal protein L3 N(5)-glutamine methyltransferase [Candidatus Muproteobacteria bacterium RBG_16_64_11]
MNSNLTPPRTVRDWVLSAERRFQAAGLYFGHGTDNARDEAAWLVCAALGIESAHLDAELERELTPAQHQKILDLVEARIATRKPLAYLLHEAWFAGLRFYVDERVLVPRSLLGEFIRERFQPWIDPQRVRVALDLCTGSGCIAVALARAFPEARIDAADISDAALAVARINIAAHGLDGRVRAILSDLFAGLGAERYDLIVTNPPYVDAADLASLPAEYRREPRLALAAGRQGLDVINRILAQAADRLTPGGILVAEVGNSRAALQAAFPGVAFTWLTDSQGDESVFLLGAEDLARHRPLFAAALNPR